jgi:hypothetical protein
MSGTGNYRTYSFPKSGKGTMIHRYFRYKRTALKNQRALRKRGVYVKIQKKPKYIHGSW